MALKQLLGSSGWLSLVQIADNAIPIFTFPVVTRALGLEFYGDYALIVGICSYFGLLPASAAYVTGPKIVAEARHDRSRLDKAVSQIIFFQLATFGAVAIVFSCLLSIIPGLTRHLVVSIVVFLQLNTVGLTPTWFFLGIERTKMLGLSQLVIRAGGAAAIIALIKEPSDLPLYAIINLVVASGSFLLLTSVMIGSGVRLTFQGLEALRSAAASTAGIMVSEFCAILYSSAGPVIVGTLLGSAAAGAFAFVDRVLVAIRSLSVPIFNSAFPILCRYRAHALERASNLRRVLFPLVLLAGLSLSCALLFSASYLARFFGGEQFANLDGFLRLVSLVPFFAVCSAFFGTLSLVVFGFIRQFNQVRIAGSVLGAGCLYLGTVLAGVQGALAAVVVVEVVVAGSFIATLLQRRFFLEAIGGRGLRTAVMN